ncbi:MAG: hypothetical protein JSV88_31390 [Candidatus Aminicenantes bacterium]|nr:MAG: hypothetical protein JSV88_31390 [Candidatus Aminicenantes bacterium]
MKYTIGTVIPAEEILRRFKDEDEEIFVEVRGMKDVLFRVTDGDRVYYKIERAKMKGEDLILVEDYTRFRPKKSYSFPVMPTDKHQAIQEEADTEIEPAVIWGLKANAPDKKPEERDERKEFNEGEKIPKHLRAMCKKNDYGGYNLRYNKIFYMLDKKYRVEIKTADSAHKYELEDYLADYDTSDEIITLTDPITNSDTEPEPETDMDMETEMETDMDMEIEIELKRGDILPPHLRTLCESEFGYGYGSRITIGKYLYLLDSNFKVLQKMKISYLEEGEQEKSAPAAETGTRAEVTAKNELPVEEIVTNVVKTVNTALETYHIKADYFKETVLAPANREILIQAYHGDLENLNDDTREAASQGKTVKLPGSESGFNLFKAVLIHELYIKSTVPGRGNNMHYFLTHIDAAHPDGTLGKLQDNLSLKDQKKIIEFFKNQAHVYTDKTDIILRVHLKVRSSIFQQYSDLCSKKENIRLNALLIAKLYENTTRLDRGDGITMMRLTRDILEYPDH